MKKGILLLVTMFLMVSTAEANNREKNNSRMGYSSIYNAEPIQFMERGIKFYVFLDGEFDFNTRPGNYHGAYFKKGKKRKHASKKNFYKGVRIERDYRGNIRKVGNVFINYNRYGKVSRIGSIFVDYNFRNVSRVGNLTIQYNRRGDIEYYGKVKRGHRHNDRYGDWDSREYAYNNSFFLQSNFISDYESFDEDDNYMYYRSRAISKGKKGSIIKRKKQFDKKSRR